MNIVLLPLLLLFLVVSFVFIIKYRKLRNVNSFQSNIIESTPISMFILDKNKYIIDIHNISPGAMAGHAVSDIVGKHLTVFSRDPESPFYQACSMLEESFDRMMVTREDEYFQYTLGDAYLEATIKLIEGDYVISMVEDISIATRKINDMMQKKQNEISVALRAGGLYSWTYDIEADVVDSKMDNDIIDRPMTYQELMKKIAIQDRGIVDEGFASIIRDGKDHCEFSVRVANSYGITQWSNIHAVPDEYDQDGNVKTIIGSQKNITKDVEAMNELVRLRDVAEESNRLKSAFLANMSHEIRTPLNAIVGFANIVVSTEDKEEAAEYVKIIELNNELLLNIINDVLDLAKIESNMLEFNYANIHVSDLLGNLGESARLKVAEGVDLIVDDVDSDIDVESDIFRLSQVIMNFLNNAAKFTSKGSISLGCRRADNDKVYFYVKDTGIGISKEDLPTVFERFMKINNFIQGTGLGLSICETIIRNMGGEIGVESELGSGSTFWFKIPVKRICDNE